MTPQYLWLAVQKINLQSSVRVSLQPLRLSCWSFGKFFIICENKYPSNIVLIYNSGTCLIDTYLMATFLWSKQNLQSLFLSQCSTVGYNFLACEFSYPIYVKTQASGQSLLKYWLWNFNYLTLKSFISQVFDLYYRLRKKLSSWW